jgi:dienelactone hydrolase
MSRYLCCFAICAAALAQPGPGLDDRSPYILTEPVPGSDIPVQLTFVMTRDAIYTPIALRKPKGDGPFPAVLFFAGNGGGGMPEAKASILNRGYISDRFLAAGYVAAWIRYRAEVPGAWRKAEKLAATRRILSRPPLDYDDLIGIVDYVKGLRFVDPKRVGLVGNSHGGELILRAASEIDVAAAVPSEPAAAEFLGIEGEDPVPKPANKAGAMERIRRINTPLLIMGRDGDHLQGTFRLVYELLKEAGKQVEWVSYKHPRHGFIFPGRGKDGAYHPDEIQLAAIEGVLKFFGRYLKP